MTLNLNLPVSENRLTPKITVIGLGGAGGNAVNNMIQANLEGVDFLVANTDAQALSQSLCQHTVQIGRHITQGLGAGSRPDVGRAAAEEAMDELLAALEGVHMVFIAAGMGGGTGTGAAPVIARAAREAGILTVGVCTKPFQFEGVHRMRIAETGLSELQQYVDTLIIIPNQNLFRVANEKTTFADAFKMADDVLHAGVRGVTDLIVMPGLINLDFADIRAVMSEMGKAMMGTGEAEGDNRAVEAAEAAISNPLLDEVSMKGARGVLINITGGDDLTLFEVDEAANRIRDEVDPEANIIFGSTFEQATTGRMRVSVVATGIDSEEAVAPQPMPFTLVGEHARAAHAANGTGEAPQPMATRAAEEAERPEEEPGDAGRDAEDAEVAQAAASAHAGEADDRRAEAAPAPAEPAPRRANGTAADPREDDFIAPAAAQAETPDRPASAARPAAHADPFAAAELANSGRRQLPEQGLGQDSPTRRRTNSLLAKVTGAARAFHEATQGEEHIAPARPASGGHGPATHEAGRNGAASAQRPATEEARGTHAFEPPRPTPVNPEAQTHGEPKARPSQPRLTGLDPAERVGVSPAEEDLLEIPAFLRRQAN